MNFKISNLFGFLGRILLAIAFSVAIPRNFSSFQASSALLETRDISPALASFFLSSSLIFLVFGVIYVLFKSNSIYGPLFLVAFLILKTLILYISPFNTVAVLNNLGLMGALFLAVSNSKKNSVSLGDESYMQLIRSLMGMIKKIFDKTLQ